MSVVGSNFVIYYFFISYLFISVYDYNTGLLTEIVIFIF